MQGFKITIFGMITISSDKRIVNIFVFVIWVRLNNTCAFRLCVVFFFSGNRVTALLPPTLTSEGARTSMTTTSHPQEVKRLSR